MCIKVKKIVLIATFVMLLAMSSAIYAVVIGDWESDMDGWDNWDAEAVYTPGAAVGVTLNSGSLRVDQAGWGQSLSIKLQDSGLVDAFMANSFFSIDVSVAADDGTVTGGYSQVSSVAMNAEGPGWTTVSSDSPINFYWWSGSSERTLTLVIDYSEFRNAMTGTGFVEIIFTLNTGGGAPTDMYFDNAQLYGGTGEIGDYADEVMADSPVLYLRLEDNTTLNTGSGNGSQADSSGSNFWAAHRADTEFRVNEGIGNCRYLPNSGNQNVIAAANSPEFPGWDFDFDDAYAFSPDDITFELWINPQQNELEEYAMIFQQVKTNYSQAPGMGNNGGTIRVLSGTQDPNAAEWWYSGVETPNDGMWHHVVLSYQESYGAEYEMAIQLFMDGQLAASRVVGTEKFPALLGPELDHVLIGAANDLGYSWNNFKGLVDEFAIYDSILLPERVAVHYASGMCAMSTGDITGDCKVDMADFAQMASSWMVCNDPNSFSEPGCGPSW